MNFHDSEGHLTAGNGEISIPVHHVSMEVTQMDMNEEIRKLRDTLISISIEFTDSSSAVFPVVQHFTQEMQRQQKLQAALEASGIAHLDGYNPYLN